MNVVIAPDSFKGTLSAADAADALAVGWADARPGDTVVRRPMADGGEGTLAAFERAVTGAERVPVRVTGPDDRPVDAAWVLLPDGTGVVELAATSGIELLDSLRPMSAHTRGFGKAIAAALDRGVERLVLGIGSSASTDGGTGMLTALGAAFVDAEGRRIQAGAAGLEALARVDLDGLRPSPPGGVAVLTDVSNPLVGAAGAAAVFGPQKGAGPADVARMEAGLVRLAALLPGTAAAAWGAGAAGGTGFGLLVWGARLTPGAEVVARLIGLDDAVAAASVVLTGEGAHDASTAAGKVPATVAGLAAEADVPVMLVAGRIDDEPVGYAASVSLTALAGPDAAMAAPARWLREAGRRLAADWTELAGSGQA